MGTANHNPAMHSNCSSSVYQSLSLVSFNMHGFYQDLPVLQDLMENSNNFDMNNCPDVILLQEHQLTPANLHNSDKYFADYFSFGCSAMSKCLESGMLRGRPFGGVITLVNNKWRKVTETVKCDDRFVIIKIGDLLIVNVYFPCQGTADRIAICEDMICEIGRWCERFFAVSPCYRW